MNLKNNRTAAVGVSAAMLVTLGGVGGAFAADAIGSRDIKNDSIRSIDVDDDSIGMRDFNDHTRGEINQPGPRGPQGEQGETGPAGPPGTAKYVGAEWGIVDRNTIGNGDAALRSGPIAPKQDGTISRPPFGQGSLGLRTGSSSDKATFGNQVDFLNDPLGEINTASYSVFGNAASNSPSLQFEVDPNVADTTGEINYSTLTFVPENVTPNTWVKVDASEAKRWYFTGRAGAQTGCNDATYCTLAEAKQKAPEAKILTVQFSKGRDAAWSGAVDGLVLNDTTYDFEPFGVSATTGE